MEPPTDITAEISEIKLFSKVSYIAPNWKPNCNCSDCSRIFAILVKYHFTGSLLIAGPALFFKNYEKEEENFFGTKKGTVTYKYGAGFAITIVGGASLLVSTLLGLIVFVTIVRKMCRLSAGDAKVCYTILSNILKFVQ